MSKDKDEQKKDPVEGIDSDALLSEFTGKLKALIAEYELTDFSFCATRKDIFVGSMCIDQREDMNFIFRAVCNIGRLWQHARTSTRDILDGYERYIR